MIEYLRSLTLEQKIGQLFFIGVAGAEVDVSTRELLNEISPGGVCLFSRNIREAAQTRKLLDDIRSALAVEPFLSIDQEGGLVDRLRKVVTPMPSASSIADSRDAARLAEIIAAALSDLGFNMDFAPVVDVIDHDRSQFPNGLTSRTFGKTRDDVLAMAGAFLITLQDNGIIGCLKHFPGLGAARVDSHEELPIVELDRTEWELTDLFPYRELLPLGNVHAVIVAHMAIPNLYLQETDRDGKLLPSSLSYNFITSLLRRDLSYDGLVITDDLEMGAIIKNYGIGDACKMAINAGADMLAICADPAVVRSGYQAVLAAVNSGEITTGRIDESLKRIAAAKSRLSEPMPFDPDRLDALSAEIVQLTERSNQI